MSASTQQKALTNPAAVLRNKRSVDRVHTILAIFIGLAAGILGLTGLRGFAAFAAALVVVAGAWPPAHVPRWSAPHLVPIPMCAGLCGAVSVLLVKMGGDVTTYFPTSFFGFLFGGMFDHLMSFLLFWTLSYALVHIY